MIRQHAGKPASKQSWSISRSYIIPAVFVIAFAGIGVSLLFGSNAQTSCSKQTILVGQHGGCVQDIQDMLNATASNWDGMPVAPNGHFDSSTQTQLKRFQSTHIAQLNMFTGGTGSGIVDSGTWRALCYADNTWHGSETAFVRAGCQGTFGIAWGGSYSSTPWLN